jgi:hypothetical protein
MNSVSVLKARPSWSLTGSVPAITVRLEDDFPAADMVLKEVSPGRSGNLGLLTVT